MWGHEKRDIVFLAELKQVFPDAMTRLGVKANCGYALKEKGSQSVSNDGAWKQMAT